VLVGFRVEAKNPGHAQASDQPRALELEDNGLAMPRHAVEHPAFGALPD